jgi:predicted membrane channel-forming protein YqfA (hemolysin III family)
VAHGEVKASWRKPAGALAILLLILVWVVLVASFSAEIGALPVLVQLVIYVVLGIVWIMPLKPLLRWMETGHWRLPRN